MLKKIKRFFDKIFLLPLYPETQFVNRVADKLLQGSDDWFFNNWSVTTTESDNVQVYGLIVESEKYKITFWVRNKMYAYFSSGKILNKELNEEAYWTSEMPSKDRLFKLYDRFCAIENGINKNRQKRFNKTLMQRNIVIS